VVQTRLRSGWRGTLGSIVRSATRGPLPGLAFPRDSYAAALIAASLLSLGGLVAYVVVSLPTVPPLLPLHYDGSGSVDLIGPRTDLYRMPAIGAVVFLADLLLGGLLYRQDRWAALALLSMSVLVQLMLIVATLNVVRLAFGD
jgi:hypothetical protein